MGKQSRLAYYRDTLGFTNSTNTFGRPNLVSIACDSCAALVINSVPCHETGCPNATKECNGCNARIPARPYLRYCEDCR